MCYRKAFYLRLRGIADLLVDMKEFFKADPRVSVRVTNPIRFQGVHDIRKRFC